MDEFKDFTLAKKWSEFSAYTEELHKKNVKVTLIIDPGIDVTSDSFARALKNVNFIDYVLKYLLF
jgi:alpha-glucosidase (family GH31 glycosyl hydrolase)